MSEPDERVEWDGNKYYLPRAEVERLQRARVTGAAIAVLFFTLGFAILGVAAWLVIGRP